MEIKIERKDLSQKTVKTYILNIKWIVNLVKIEKLDDFKTNERKLLIIRKIQDLGDTIQKTLLTSLNVFLKSKKINVDIFTERIKELNTNIRNQSDKQQKSKKQYDNWLTKKQLWKVIREYYNSEVKRLIKKANKTVADKMKVQDYIMLSLYEYIQVRNDFANMIVLTKKSIMW